MNSISVTFDAPSVAIPLAYHHQVQSLIYALVRRGGGDSLHDEGPDFGQRSYKLFTFSSLRGGKVSGRDRLLHIDKSLFLDVRGVRPEFYEALLAGLAADKAIDLFGHPLTVRSVKESRLTINENRLRIKMLSPLTLHKTYEDGYTNYLNPLDADFSEEMNKNFSGKYFAFYGVNPSAAISVRARAVGIQDKYITMYKKAGAYEEKSIYITGWRGEYELIGKPEYISFLYYCGIGARNSDGFGMFEPI